MVRGVEVGEGFTVTLGKLYTFTLCPVATCETPFWAVVVSFELDAAGTLAPLANTKLAPSALTNNTASVRKEKT
jgi:hypothetical protein